MMDQVSQDQQATQYIENHYLLRKRQPLSRWFPQVGKRILSWMQVAPTRSRQKSTRTASILQKLLQGVLWAAFGAFLFASLPHVAYFFAAFEPEGNNGSLNDYWWFVSYGLAASIDVTAFLLSLNIPSRCVMSHSAYSGNSTPLFTALPETIHCPLLCT